MPIPSSFDRSLILPPKPVTPPILGSDRRLSGAERLIAKNAPVVEWLTRVHGEMAVDGEKSWPVFDLKGLSSFLAALGVDLSDPQGKGITGAALDLPPDLGAPEGCVKALQGAPFLTRTPGAVCAHLARRRAMARL
jgi:hypothetical protein